MLKSRNRAFFSAGAKLSGLAESTKFSSIRKPYTYTSVSDITVAVRKFLAYESRQALEYEIFMRTKISAITASSFRNAQWNQFLAVAEGASPTSAA